MQVDPVENGSPGLAQGEGFGRDQRAHESSASSSPPHGPQRPTISRVAALRLKPRGAGGGVQGSVEAGIVDLGRPAASLADQKPGEVRTLRPVAGEKGVQPLDAMGEAVADQKVQGPVGRGRLGAEALRRPGPAAGRRRARAGGRRAAAPAPAGAAASSAPRARRRGRPRRRWPGCGSGRGRGGRRPWVCGMMLYRIISLAPSYPRFYRSRQQKP